jgi:UDPglucose 6-dehydrogenase
MLQARGALIRAYDPQCRSNAEGPLVGVEWCPSALDAAAGADLLVVLTEWNEFRALDLKQVRQVMLGNVLVDLRNVYTEALAEEAGLVYHGIGRRLPSPVNQPHDKHRDFAANGRDVRQATH